MAGTLDSNFRVIVDALPKMKPIMVRGEAYSGPQLAWWIAVNPEQPLHEANRTPQLVFELGRLCAAALADYEVAEARHVAMKEGLMYKLATDLDAAKEYGMLDDEATKLPAKGVVDSFVHSLPEYVKSKENMAALAESHRVLMYAIDAAKLRREAIIITERSGGSPPSRHMENPHTPAPVPTGGSVGDDGTTSYHAGYGDVVENGRQPRMSMTDQEAWAGATNQARTPIPSVVAGPPPTTITPPATVSEAPPSVPAKKRTPPPPPKRN